MAKPPTYVSNTREVIFTGNSFGKAAHRALIARYGRGDRSQMRIGRFSVVDIPGTDLLAAETYTDESIIVAGYENYRRFRLDRIEQLGRIEQALQPTHPLFAEITASIAGEREWWA